MWIHEKALNEYQEYANSVAGREGSHLSGTALQLQRALHRVLGIYEEPTGPTVEIEGLVFGISNGNLILQMPGRRPRFINNWVDLGEALQEIERGDMTPVLHATPSTNPSERGMEEAIRLALN